MFNKITGTKRDPDEPKGIYIDPKKLNNDTINFLYLYYDNKKCNLNIFSRSEQGGPKPLALKTRPEELIDELQFVEMSKYSKESNSIIDDTVSAFPYINLPNNKRHKGKRKIVEKCSAYRLRRQTENTEWWFIERKNFSTGKWQRDSTEQTYEHLMAVFFTVANPIISDIKTLKDDWVILIDNNTHKEMLLPEIPPTQWQTMKVGDEIVIDIPRGFKTIIEQYPDKIPDDATPRKWRKGQMFLETDKVYLENKSYHHRDEDKTKLEQIVANTTLPQADINDAQEKLDKIKESPVTLWVFGGGSKKRRKSVRKSVRKHRGIHQTGGKIGKLKKGYKYSGKKFKNGLPQIIKCTKL